MGGTAAGKSTLLNLMVEGLLADIGGRGRIEFVNPWDAERFEKGRSEFREHYQLTGTFGGEGRALAVRLHATVALETRAYRVFLHLRGEYTADDPRRRQPYLTRVPAVAVVLDPMAMPDVWPALQRRNEPGWPAGSPTRAGREIRAILRS